MADETIDREDLARRVADLEGTVRALTTQVERLSRELESMGEEARRLSSDMLPFRRIGPLPGHPERDAMETLKRSFEGRGEHIGGTT